jgi:phosphoglycerate dehydrogenase-like enzyme
VSQTGVVTVLIASAIEHDLVDRIAAVDVDRISVIFEPSLVPRPRYVSDQTGPAPTLDASEVQRWKSLLGQAVVSFDFDWLEPHRMPQNAPNLRWVQATSAGIGEFLRSTGLDRSDITFTTASGVHAVPLAEFVALGLLYLTKEVPRIRDFQHRHLWERYTARQLAGQRVLVVGLGRVGTQVALTCSALGLEVWGIRRSDCADVPGVHRMWNPAQLRAVLPEVDAVVLACPYTPLTHHLIGETELALMRPSAVIVNVARGAVVDQAALTECLGGGRLGGAVLDVFEEEPLPTDSPLWDLPNVLVSPHSASTVASENEAIATLFATNLRRFLDGLPLLNRYDRRRGY